MRLSSRSLAIRSAIANREEFTSSAAIRGSRPISSRFISTGRLPREYVNEIHGSDGVDYVVWSYGTPIAWHDTIKGWTVPAVKYSATTSRHQSIVRYALA